jgi:hypothetical protein
MSMTRRQPLRPVYDARHQRQVCEQTATRCIARWCELVAVFVLEKMARICFALMLCTGFVSALPTYPPLPPSGIKKSTNLILAWIHFITKTTLNMLLTIGHDFFLLLNLNVPHDFTTDWGAILYDARDSSTVKWLTIWDANQVVIKRRLLQLTHILLVDTACIGLLKMPRASPDLIA